MAKDFTVEGSLGNNEATQKPERVYQAINRWAGDDKELKKVIKAKIDEAHRLVNEARDHENQIIFDVLANFGIGDPKIKKMVAGKEQSVYGQDVYSFLRSTYRQINYGKGTDRNALYYPTRPGESKVKVPLDKMGAIYQDLTSGFAETAEADKGDDYAGKIYDFLARTERKPKPVKKTDDAVFETILEMTGYYDRPEPKKYIDPSKRNIDEQSLIDTYGAEPRVEGQKLLDWFESSLQRLVADEESGFGSGFDSEAMMYYQDVINQLQERMNSSFQEEGQGPEQGDIADAFEASLLNSNIPPRKPPKPPTAVSPGDDEGDDEDINMSVEEMLAFIKKQGTEYQRKVEEEGIEYIGDVVENIKFVGDVVDKTAQQTVEGIEAVNETFDNTSSVAQEVEEIIDAVLVKMGDASQSFKFLDDTLSDTSNAANKAVEGIEAVNEEFQPTGTSGQPTGQPTSPSEGIQSIDFLQAILKGTGRTGSTAARFMDVYKNFQQSTQESEGTGQSKGLWKDSKGKWRNQFGRFTSAPPGGGAGGMPPGGPPGMPPGGAGAGGAGAGGAAAGAMAGAALGAFVLPLITEAVSTYMENLSKFFSNRIEFAKELTVGAIGSPESVSPVGTVGEYGRTVADAFDLTPMTSVLAEPLRQSVDFLESIDTGIERLGPKLAPFSPDIIAADIDAAISRLQADIEQADKLGPILAENIRARTEFELAAQRLGTTLTQFFGPQLTKLIELATVMLNGINTLAEVGTSVAAPALQSMLDAILGPTASNAVQQILGVLFDISSNTAPKRTQAQLKELADFLNPATTPTNLGMQGTYPRLPIPGTLGVTF